MVMLENYLFNELLTYTYFIFIDVNISWLFALCTFFSHIFSILRLDGITIVEYGNKDFIGIVDTLPDLLPLFIR